MLWVDVSSRIAIHDAGLADLEAIVELHIESWRAAYRGMLPEWFLAGPVVENRLALWRERFAAPDAGRLVRKAVGDGALLGFVCALDDASPETRRNGVLLDNLHVKPGLTRKGIGTRLFHEALTWSRGRREAREPGAPVMHLWVLEENVRARRFYERVGGHDVERCRREVTPGVFASERRYVWI